MYDIGGSLALVDSGFGVTDHKLGLPTYLKTLCVPYRWCLLLTEGNRKLPPPLFLTPRGPARIWLVVMTHCFFFVRPPATRKSQTDGQIFRRYTIRESVLFFYQIGGEQWVLFQNDSVTSTWQAIPQVPDDSRGMVAIKPPSLCSSKLLSSQANSDVLERCIFTAGAIAAHIRMPTSCSLELLSMVANTSPHRSGSGFHVSTSYTMTVSL